MTHRPQFITLSPDLARALVAELRAVLDGDASYFHAELLTDDGQPIGLHMSGSDDSHDLGGADHA